jgi:branched-subunit amino acid transport protein AzlD
MGFYLRCFLIVVLSPLLALVTMIVSPAFLILIGVGYPIIVVIAGLLLTPFHLYIKYGEPPRYAQVMAAILIGAVVGVFVTYCMYWNSSFRTSNDFADVAQTVAPFMLVGVSEALAMWVLYTFGPFKIAGATGLMSES